LFAWALAAVHGQVGQDQLKTDRHGRLKRMRLSPVYRAQGVGYGRESGSKAGIWSRYMEGGTDTKINQDWVRDFIVVRLCLEHLELIVS
jgi:hypothetical protein